MAHQHTKKGRACSVIAAALTIAAVSLAPASPALAYPGDVFHTGAPAVNASPASTGASSDRSLEVDHTGAAQYAYPIEVPAGRLGMEPDLALRYSSRSPLRGGIAAGWTLHVPMIEVDTSDGALGSARYRSNLDGGGRLVAVDEPNADPGAQTFRVDGDPSYTRYERFDDGGGAGYWRVLTSDGRVHYFGGTPESRDEYGFVSSEGRWMLTRSVDGYGNEVLYHYEKVVGDAANGTVTDTAVDIALTSIEYGGNATTGQQPMIEIELQYASELDLCPGSNVPIGSEFTYRNGFRTYRGARRLDSIVTRVEGIQRRRVDLDYADVGSDGRIDCGPGKLHAPLRLLTSVTERGRDPDGLEIVLPSTTFEYGRRARQLDTPVGIDALEEAGYTVASGKRRLNPTKAGGWPTLETMWLDLDGDGRQDLLRSAPTGSNCDEADPEVPCGCAFEWQRNLGDGEFAEWQVQDLPAMPWAGGLEPDTNEDPYMRESCSLAAQFTRRTTNDDPTRTDFCGYPGNYLSYRFMDVNGDGAPDLVTALDFQKGRYRPGDDPLLLAATVPGEYPPTPSTQTTATPPEEPDWDVPTLWCGSDDCLWPACSTEEEANGECVCSESYCQDDRLWENVSSMFGAPETKDTIDSVLDKRYVSGNPFHVWPGAPYTAGPLGQETVDAAFGNAMCGHAPEEFEERFVLRVYFNDGAGSIDVDNPQISLSPIPLESDRATSRLGAGPLVASSSWHGFVDLDGDGYLDAVRQEPVAPGDEEHGNAGYQLWRGDGAGNFVGEGSDEPIEWAAPQLLSSTGTNRARVSLRSGSTWLTAHPEPESHRYTRDLVSFMDINGDGLVDLVDARPWDDSPNEQPRAFFNTGRGFEAAPGFEGTVLQGSSFGIDSLSSEARVAMTLTQDAYRLDDGFSVSVARQVDLDGDGLVDVVRSQPSAFDTPLVTQDPRINPWSPSVDVRALVNVGDRFVDMGHSGTLASWGAGLKRINLSEHGEWSVKSDFMDFDGDGLADLYANGGLSDPTDVDDCVFTADGLQGFCGNTQMVLTDDPTAGAMRLLTRVDNGQGGVLEYSYAPGSDDAVVDEGNGRVPHAYWVVDRVRSDGGFGTPTQETNYRYYEPVYNQDDDGKWGFRGFVSTETHTPAGAVEVATYDYGADWRGRVVEAVTFADATMNEAVTVVDSTYAPFELFGGAIVDHKLTDTVEHTCTTGQSVEECREDPSLIALQRTLWEEIGAESGDQTAAAWVAFRVDDKAEGNFTEGDRLTQRAHRLYAGAHHYRLRRWSESVFQRIDDDWVRQSRVNTNYMNEGRDPYQTQRYQDASTWSVTQRAYYPNGLVKTETKPEQHGSSFTRTIYDDAALYPAHVINELGHDVYFEFDLATGAQLETRGPNLRSCGAGCTAWQTTRTDVDGFGRPVRETASFDDDVLGYRMVVVANHAYHDQADPGSGVPVRQWSERLLDESSANWTATVTEFDGLGRLIRQIDDAQGVAAVTTVHYDAGGNVARIDVPDPSLDTENAGPTVSFEIEYDGLGRPIRETRPDGEWIETRYHGSRVGITEHAAGLLLGEKGREYDRFGRLVRVREMTGTDAADTEYGYDAMGRMLFISDADGVETEIAYDEAGNRLRVARADRTWRYGYDRNDNLVTITTPVPDGASELDYVTSIVYDDLDRPISRLAARRGLDDTQLDALGDGLVTISHDLGTNGIGQVSEVTLPHGAIAYGYDARGNVVEETHSFGVAQMLGLPGLSDSRTLTRRFNAANQVVDVWHGDEEVGPGSHTRVSFDGRGMPAGIHLDTPSGFVPLAALTRNAAGKVIRRAANVAGNDQEQTWTYDILGRVVSTSVTGGGLPIVHTMTYGPHDDLEHLAVQQDGTHEFDFAYDMRHQLVSANGPFAYDAVFDYSLAGRLSYASVHATPGRPMLVDREANYHYDGVEPEAVTSLVHPSGDVTYASYQHDEAGNVTSRVEQGGDAWAFTYDGENRQRVSVAPDGTEERYYYDHGGQRNLVVREDPQGNVSARFYVGGMEVEYDGVGSVTRTTVRPMLGGMDVAHVIDGMPARMLYRNTLGHLIAALDPYGNVAAGFIYGPFGEILAQEGSDVDAHRRRFNGKESDAVSGLNYYGFRYYDPLSLTWTQRDPLYAFIPDLAYDQPRRMNLYGFVLNNPLRYIDPDGRDSCNAWKPCPINPDESGTSGSESSTSADQGGTDDESLLGDETAAGVKGAKIAITFRKARLAGKIKKAEAAANKALDAAAEATGKAARKAHLAKGVKKARTANNFHAKVKKLKHLGRLVAALSIPDAINAIRKGQYGKAAKIVLSMYGPVAAGLLFGHVLTLIDDHALGGGTVDRFSGNLEGFRAYMLMNVRRANRTPAR